MEGEFAVRQMDAGKIAARSLPEGRSRAGVLLHEGLSRKDDPERQPPTAIHDTERVDHNVDMTGWLAGAAQAEERRSFLR